MNLEIRPAALADLNDVLSILDEAAAWLHSIGVTQQWPASFSLDASVHALVENQLRLGQFYLAYMGALAIGVLRLVVTDPQAWPEADDDEALYLHSFAVRRALSGTGVSEQMLTWAREKAGSDGKAELRARLLGGQSEATSLLRVGQL